MNLLNKCTLKEIELMKRADIYVDNKEYINEELEQCERKIVDFIMNHSSKNNQIDKLRDEYSSIFRTINLK